MPKARRHIARPRRSGRRPAGPPASRPGGGSPVAGRRGHGPPAARQRRAKDRVTGGTVSSYDCDMVAAVPPPVNSASPRSREADEDRVDRDHPDPGAAALHLQGQLLQDAQPVARSSPGSGRPTGIVGEAYNADTDEEQAEILAIIHDEIAPAGHRPRRDRDRAGLGGDAAGDLRPAARPRCRDAGDGLRRHAPSGTRSARRSASRCGGCGAATATGSR